jgi:hypothetical protein
MSEIVRGVTGEQLSPSLRESILARERDARRLDLSRDDLD